MRYVADRKKKVMALFILSLLLVITVIISLMLGRYEITVRELFAILASKLTDIPPFWKTITENIVWEVRIPRIIIAVLVGAALSVSGTAYQCIFRNPMAAPDVLGASTGAAFGAALAILLGKSSVTITVWAFISSIVCIVLVLMCSRVCKGSSVLGLILAGIVISSLFQAGTSYLKLIADPHNTLPEITYWLMGSLSGIKMSDLSYIWLPLLLGLIPIFILRWKMNLLTLEDDEAKTMGINIRTTRIIIIICSTLLTAACVSVSGVIGWVGLVIPHMARRIAGSDCRSLIPVSALLGGIFLLIVDDLARNLYSTELPLGILTSVIGAPFFIYLLSRKGNI